MSTQQLYKGVHNFTYRVNRFALADLENAVFTVDHLIDKHLKRGYADLGKSADGELITTTVDFSITSQFNTLQCGRASDVAIRIEQFSNDRLEAVARLFISNSPKESDKEEICQATISRQVVNIKGFSRVKEDRNQGNSLINRQCLVSSQFAHSNKL